MPDDPPLPADLVIVPGTGSLVFAGQVSDILPLPLIPRDSITPGTGALAFAGNVSTIFTTTPLILSPTSGALVVAGNPSTILVNSVGVGPTVAPGTGALTLTGFPPDVSTTAPWTPVVLASSVLKAWYDASDAASITASSGAVSQWNDKSGNANHITQATGTSKPTTGTQTINSLNVLDFDGGDFLSKTSGTSLPDNSPGFTIIAVVKYDSLSAAGWIAFPTNAAASDFSWSFGRNGANSMGIRGYQGTPANQAAFNDNTTAVQLLSGIATTTLRQIWQNGTSKATNTNTDSANTAGRIYVGSDNNPTTFLDGRIAEIIIIDGTDATIREKAEGYAAWKWGLDSSLDAGHPYHLVPPMV